MPYVVQVHHGVTVRNDHFKLVADPIGPIGRFVAYYPELSGWRVVRKATFIDYCRAGLIEGKSFGTPIGREAIRSIVADDCGKHGQLGSEIVVDFVAPRAANFHVLAVNEDMTAAQSISRVQGQT